MKEPRANSVETFCGWIVGLIVLLNGCATSTPSQNFDIPREEFFAQVRVIAQAPMILPSGMSPEKTQVIHAKFQQLLAEAAQQRGFTVIPALQTYQISDRLLRELGGALDPRKDLQKLRVYRDYLRREIRERFRADAVLAAEIIPVTAKYSGTTARWHGASQSIAATGLSVTELLFGEHAGTVPAFSLLVWVEDAVSGARLWSGLGGVHVLSKREAGKWAPVPVEDALSDQARCRDAVKFAFKSLRD